MVRDGPQSDRVALLAWLGCPAFRLSRVVALDYRIHFSVVLRVAVVFSLSTYFFSHLKFFSLSVFLLVLFVSLTHTHNPKTQSPQEERTVLCERGGVSTGYRDIVG